MPRKSCLFLVLAFALLLAAPAVAAPGPAAPVAVGGSGLLQHAWGWIMSVWSDARGCINPDGGDVACTPAQARAGIDPNGGNGQASPSTYFMKARCGINPDGSTVCVP